MESRRRHLSGGLSSQVAESVRRLRDKRGLTTAELIAATGFKPNYYYLRMRLEVDFTLSDLEHLASALGVTPNDLLGESINGPGLQLDGAEFARRLGRLMRTYEHDADAGGLVALVRQRVPDFTDADWVALTSANDTVTVDVGTVDAIADYFGVDSAYLAEPLVDPAAERVKAELELQDALREAGAMTIAARNLGDTSPAVLRAIAEAIRTRPAG